jgi:predicted Zn-ribbon and HTH transcriptional regulator
MLSQELLNIAKKNKSNYSTATLKRMAKCYNCGKEVEDWDERQKQFPRCNKCKGLLIK